MFTSSALVAVLVTAMPLEQALEAALAENARLKMARSELSVAEAGVPAAHDWSMPKLGLQASKFSSEGSLWRVSLSWRPPNPWEWSASTELAKQRAAQARCELADETWQVLADLRLAWLDYSGALAHQALAQQTIEVRQHLLDLVRSRLKEGQGTQLDLNLAALGAADAAQDLLRWQNAELRAVQLIGGLVGTPIEPVSVPLSDAPPALPTFDELASRLARHPALEALQASVRQAAATENLLVAKRLPWPELSAVYRQRLGSDPGEDGQVGLSVPLALTPAPALQLAHSKLERASTEFAAKQAQRITQLRVLLARGDGLLQRWHSFQADFQQTLASHRELRARVLHDSSLDPTALMAADRQAIDLEHKRLEVQLDLARVFVELDAVAGPP